MGQVNRVAGGAYTSPGYSAKRNFRDHYNIIIYLSIHYDMKCPKKNKETRLKRARILPDPLNDVQGKYNIREQKYSQRKSRKVLRSLET